MSHIDEVLNHATRSAPLDRLTSVRSESAAATAAVSWLDAYPRERPVDTVQGKPSDSAQSRPFEPARAISSNAAGHEPAARPQRAGAPVLVITSVRHPAPTGLDLEQRLAGAVDAGVVEQCRRLAGVLQNERVDRQLNTLLVASALPEERSTPTALHLALNLTESGRVLLIDANLRKPSVHVVLGIGNQRGLSELLGSESLDLPLVEVSPALSVMTAGEPRSDVLTALKSDRMRWLLQECASRFDWVLLDAPPVDSLPDAPLLARHTQAVLFVIGSRTPFRVAESAIATLGGACIVGTILHGLPQTASPSEISGSAADE